MLCGGTISAIVVATNYVLKELELSSKFRSVNSTLDGTSALPVVLYITNQGYHHSMDPQRTPHGRGVVIFDAPCASIIFALSIIIFSPSRTAKHFSHYLNYLSVLQ